jgi:hypothetical protein
MREAYVLVDKAHSAYPIHAIELNSALFIKALETDAQFWPSGMPEVDGIVLCYDASAEGNSQGSFDYIVRLTGRSWFTTFGITNITNALLSV